MGSFASARTGGSDDCLNAQVLPGPGFFQVDTTNASLGSVLPPCATIARDVWFRWTPSASGEGRIETCTFAGGDSVLAVYVANGCPTQPPVACNDFWCGVGSEVIFAANAGTTYVIQVGAVGSSNVTGQLSVYLNTLTPNDSCGLATPIAGTGTFPVTTLGATPGLPQSGCDPALADVWYSWVAPQTGVAVLQSCGATTADSIFSVRTGPDCATSTLLACNDNFCGLQARVSFAVTAGAAYLLQVGQRNSTAYVGTFQLDVFTPPVNDSCATPLAVSGPGPHPFDLSFATTGTEGQNESACQTTSGPSIQRDAWFVWTAGATGRTSLSTCNGTAPSIDTKIAVYQGFGCPSPQSALGCDDNGCNIQSEVCFDAIQGATYTIQIGAVQAAGLPTGTFVLIGSSGSGTNDDCSTPLVIAGPGPHAFDTTSATAGCAGQSNPICGGTPFDVFDRDRWFAWTAPSTGAYEVSTCGLAGGSNTKVAIYSGVGCPAPNNAIGCSRTAQCGAGSSESRACFQGDAGVTYTIQIGTGFGNPPGVVGAFTVELQSALPGCRYDDGSSETAGGLYLTAGGVLWMHAYGAPGTATTVRSVSTAFGSPAVSSAQPSNGTPCVVAVWDDPDDDGDPSNAVLVQTVSGVVLNSATDAFTTFTFPQPLVLSGVYFVGAALPSANGSLPAPVDSSSCRPPTLAVAWFAANVGGFIQLANLQLNSLPPAPVNGAAWLLRADCTTEGGIPVCVGDGTGLPCPCANTSTAPGAGCKHSQSDALYAGAGARLELSGVPSLSYDQVLLRAHSLPGSASCLVFQGTTSNPAVFGDGLRCASGTVMRLVVRSATNGAVQYGFGVAGDPAVHVRGAVQTPGTRVYQVWYRNSAPFCTPSGFNFTNGLSVLWSA
ncbi:MAG: hypothetical protein NTY35_07640 [Planctomycetota bacterium]|nr:hypothetical protein [Planctomycetota bacterium]